MARTKGVPRKYSDIKAARMASAISGSKAKRSIQVAGSRIVGSSAVQAIKEVARSAGETKRNGVYQSQTQMITNGQNLLNGIAQGDTEITRDGKKINMNGLQINVAVAPASATAVPTYGWWAVILDRQPNGAALTPAGVYDTTGSVDLMLAVRNVDNLKRYKVLKRQDFVVGTIDDGCYPKFEEYIDLKKALQDVDRNVRYSGTGATIASIATNSLYFVWAVSGQANFAEGTNYPYITMNSVLKYTDL